MDTHVQGIHDQLATTDATIAFAFGRLEKTVHRVLVSHLNEGVPNLHTIQAYLIEKRCPKPTVDFVGRPFERLNEILKLHDGQQRRVSVRETEYSAGTCPHDTISSLRDGLIFKSSAPSMTIGREPPSTEA